MPPRAIETRYGGCHFRSRLEARWAVFFDQRGIAWEYEPQGFELEHRLTNESGTFRYLPDFWLPGFDTYAEVKGDVDEATARQLADAAAALGRLVVLYPIPRLAGTGEWKPWPTRLKFYKGDLEAAPWLVAGAAATIGNDSGRLDTTAIRRGSSATGPGPLLDAITAAHSSRFEFGRSGPT